MRIASTKIDVPAITNSEIDHVRKRRQTTPERFRNRERETKRLANTADESKLTG